MINHFHLIHKRTKTVLPFKSQAFAYFGNTKCTSILVLYKRNENNETISILYPIPCSWRYLPCFVSLGLQSTSQKAKDNYLSFLYPFDRENYLSKIAPESTSTYTALVRKPECVQALKSFKLLNYIHIPWW